MVHAMMMAGTALALSQAASAPAWAQAAPTAAASEVSLQTRLALARDIIDLGMPPATREATFFKVVEQMTAQMREASLQTIKVDDPKALAILDRWLDRWVADSKPTLRSHIPALMEGWAAAYADIYTERELADIKAFVATPSGAVFFQRMQDVIGNQKFAVANQAYMNDVMARLPEAQAELMADLQAHLEKTQPTE